MDIEVRRATRNDAPVVVGVVRAAYERYLELMDRPPAPLLRDYADAIRQDVVWVIGKPVVGVVVLVDDGDVLEIENVAVHPKQQGGGLGRRLIEFAEAEARRRRRSRVTLYTNEVMVEDVAMYQHLGFREVHRSLSDGYRRVHLEKDVGRSESVGRTEGPDS